MSRAKFLALFAFLVTVAIQPLMGQSTWDGAPDGGGASPNGNWNTAVNWVGDTVPVDGFPFLNLTFAGTTNLATINNLPATSGGTNIDSIVFAPGAGSFTLSAGSTPSLDMLGLSSNTTDSSHIINNSASSQTINIPLIIRGDFTDSMTVDTASGNITINGVISQTAGAILIKQGGQTLTLTNSNSYGGGTRIDDGILSVTNSGALGSGTVTMNGGTLRANVNLNNDIVLNNTTNTFQPSGFYRQLNGQISGAGGFILANGGGTTGLELTNAANNFGGNVTINGGSTFLRLTNSEVIPDTASVTNNGNLRLDVAGGGTETIAGLSGTGSVWVPLGNNNLHTLVVGAGNASSTFAGQFGPTGQNNAFLALQKIGTGTLTMTGGGLASAGVTVDGGTLRFQAGRGFNEGFFANVNNVPITINTGATLESASAWNLRSNNIVNINGGTLSFLADSYLNNITLDNGSITTTGAGRPWRTGNFANGVINVNNSGAGSSNISGLLTFVGTGAAPMTTFNVADGAAAVDLTMSSAISDHPGFEGQMQLVKSGAGLMSLTGDLDYTGGTVVNGGTLRLAQGVAFPSAGSTGQFGSPHTVTVNSGGTLQLNNHWVMGDGLANQVVVNGGSLEFLNSDNYLGNIVLDEGNITTSGGIRPWRTGNWGSGLITVNNTGAGSSNISGSLAFVGNGASPFTTFNVANGAAAVDLTMSSTIFDHPGFEGQMQLVKTGAGTMVLSGNSTYSGGTRIDDGALWATSPTALGSGTVTMNGGTLRMSNNLNNNIVLNNTTNTIQPSGFYHQLNGQISGPGGFILANGGGTTGLELTNPANNFGGDVTINGGATYLRLTASEVIPNTANVTNNGNLRLDVPGGGTETISGLSGSGSVWVPTSNNNLHTLVVGAGNASSTFAGQFGPAGQNNAFLALQKIGSGTLTMTGGGLASAGVTVDGGTLRFQSGRGFNEGFFTNVDNVPITINAGATLESASSWNMRSNNMVSINGGTLSFLADSYLNNISMDEGTITTVLAGRPWRTGNFANGVINVNNSGAGSSNISGLLTFVGTGAGATTTFNVADGSAAIDLTVSSNISDHPGFEGQMRLIKTGAGTMALTNPSSSWDGGVSINGGVITVSQLTPGNNNGPLGGAFGTAAFLSFDGGTLQYTGGNVGSINRSFTLNAGGGTIDIANPGTTVTWTDAAGAGPIVGLGTFTKTGPGTLVISDLTGGAGQGNSYSGGTVIDNGTLVGISAGAATSPFGTGQITLNGANDTALFGRGGDTVLNNNIVITAGGGTTTIGADSGTRTIYNGTVNINKNVVFRGSATDRTTFLGVISGTGNILVNGGDRTTWQANNNTFVGDVDIQDAGTVLQIGNPGGGNEIPDSSNVNIGPGARLHLVFVDETIGGLTGNGTIAFFPSGALGASTLSIGAGGVSSTFDGVIENGSPSLMSIAKIGSGTLTFNGDHTYTGTTDVDVGTLILNGTHTGAGDYNIASGATLGGDGEIALGAGNSVNVAATPGVISPGPGFSGTNPANPADVGTFTISGSGTVLDMDGILQIDIVSPIEHDLLKILGDADIDPGATLNINGETDFTNLDFSLMGFQLGDRVDILMADQLANGTSFGNFPDNTIVHGPGGWPVFFGNDGSTLFLQAVPEPASIAIWTLLGLVLAAFGWRMRSK